MTSPSLPVATDPVLAAELHAELRALVDELDRTAKDPRFAELPGLRAAFSLVLRAVRDLDLAVLPLAPLQLPTDAELVWVEDERSVGACSIPIAAELEPAEFLVTTFMARARTLNRLLGAIQFRLPNRQAPRELVSRFAFAMGYLYTQICQPLHRQHPVLEPPELRDE